MKEQAIFFGVKYINGFNKGNERDVEEITELLKDCDEGEIEKLKQLCNELFGGKKISLKEFRAIFLELKAQGEKRDDGEEPPPPPAPAVPSGSRASQQDQLEKQSSVEKTPSPTPSQAHIQRHPVLSNNASRVFGFICEHIAGSQREKAEQAIRDTLDKITSDSGQQKFLTELHKRIAPKTDPDMPVEAVRISV